MRTRTQGFTLIELIVALVIASILAAIAVPSYINYSRKSHRTEAKTALLDMAGLEERYFSVNNTYSANPADFGYPGPWPVIIGSGYYQVNAPVVTAATAPTALLPAGTPATYTLTAVPIGDQVNDTQCTTFTLTSAGVQGALPAGNAFTCWH
jgi:type IV pilus assembly protein PilE